MVTSRITKGGRTRLANPPPIFFSGEGRIQMKYQELGGAAALGEPISKEEGKVWTFANGSCICDNPKAFTAFEIHGAIYAKWISLGGLAFGLPTTDETPTSDHVGRFNHFENGKSIYWSPNTGAAMIVGAIREKWAQLGWERFGYPVTDELTTADGRGRFNHFNTGGSIYWTPQTGAHAVYGDIRKRWEQLGWEASYLGYPTSDEVDFAEGGRANDFENGGIYWWPDTNAIDLRDVVVHYTGLHCFGETDNDQASSADEPYAIISITTPKTVATFTTRVYEGVDAGESRPDLLEIYRGRPYGMNIGAVLMENDFGDPNKYKEQVQQTVMGVHRVGTIALGLIPVVGPAIAAIAGPALGSLMPSIGGAINDLFDWDDDRIGGANLTIPAKQMVLLAARTPNSSFKNIGFKIETGLISGDGASYKIYFGIVPA